MDFDAEIEIILPCKMTGHDFLAMYKKIFVLEVSIFCFLDIKNNEVLREMERRKNGNTIEGKTNRPPRREERCFLYFNHLSKEFLEQMVPHFKALI